MVTWDALSQLFVRAAESFVGHISSIEGSQRRGGRVLLAVRGWSLFFSLSCWWCFSLVFVLCFASLAAFAAFVFAAFVFAFAFAAFVCFCSCCFCFEWR